MTAVAAAATFATVVANFAVDTSIFATTGAISVTAAVAAATSVAVMTTVSICMMSWQLSMTLHQQWYYYCYKYRYF